MDQLFNPIYQLQKNFELFFWIVALSLLFLININSTTPSLCLLKWLKISFCPGCGLGHSIHSALHLQLGVSIKQHPMGIAAVFIIFKRIISLILNS